MTIRKSGVWLRRPKPIVDVKGAWDLIKAEEKAERAARRNSEEAVHTSLLSGVKAARPALSRAKELQRKGRQASASTGMTRARC
jgi:hypothetical protein